MLRITLAPKQSLAEDIMLYIKQAVDVENNFGTKVFSDRNFLNYETVPKLVARAGSG